MQLSRHVHQITTPVSHWDRKRGGGVATIYSFSVRRWTWVNFNLLNILPLCPKWNKQYYIGYKKLPLSLSWPLLSPILILNGDFNIHINNSADSKTMEFMNLPDSVELCQATHQHGNFLYLVVSKGLAIDVCPCLWSLLCVLWQCSIPS